MPVADCLIDTNILLYAISTEPAEASKSAVAQNLLLTNRWAWSGQVAAEFVNASTSRKRCPPLSFSDAGQWLDCWTHFEMIPVNRAVVKIALEIASRYMISYYDAQVLAAAKLANCSTMYSEDLNHGQDYDGVRVINPFLALP